MTQKSFLERMKCAHLFDKGSENEGDFSVVSISWKRFQSDLQNGTKYSMHITPVSTSITNNWPFAAAFHPHQNKWQPGTYVSVNASHGIFHDTATDHLQMDMAILPTCRVKDVLVFIISPLSGLLSFSICQNVFPEVTGGFWFPCTVCRDCATTKYSEQFMNAIT